MEPYDLPGTPLQGPVELTNCDREPIHLPATIQPHGCMIAVRESDETDRRLIVSVSENLFQWIPERCLATHASVASITENDSHHKGPIADDTPRADDCQSLIGQPIATIAPELESLAQVVSSHREGKRLRRPVQIGDRSLIASAHHCDDLILIELERDLAPDNTIGPELVGQLFAGLEDQQLEQIYQSTIEIIRSFTGFDRVMLYRFHDDDHGSVIAEAKRDDQEAFLGLHYPAGDIPLPARRLYVLNWIRVVSDVNADPIPMSPAMIGEPGASTDQASSSRSIDMSYAQLRAISPIHLEYLRNMGVGASMSISIINGDRLWGLIACHHRTEKVLSPDQRDVCELAGSLLSTYLSSRRQESLLARRIEINDNIAQRAMQFANREDLQQAILDSAPWFTELLSADGIAFHHRDQILCWGTTPDETQVQALLKQLNEQTEDHLAFTDKLSNWIPEASDYKDQIAGMLAIRLGRKHSGELLFFRAPYASTIHWAGDPVKSETDESGRLSPRKSFAKFTEQVEGTSLPWSPAERETAETLRATLNNLVIEQADRVQRINDELRQLNADLDAFAYAASHDLKEPLRGLNHYLYLLEQGPKNDATFQKGIGGLKRLVGRMGELLDGLLRFSRVGRQDLRWETFDLKDAMAQAIDILFGGRNPDGVRVTLVNDATIVGDFSCVREILMNLISNAIKYNESPEKVIEIGQVDYRQSPLNQFPEFGPNVMFVRDNGIGIDEKYREQVFDIFRRLHQHDQYGGGSGAGLTIVRRIIERHGGRVQIVAQESGASLSGTTFFFGWEPAS
ncbi:ATP-binding protein [Roseiconus lacunae]|uniref:ATP-binding protein n=1 Tax=Roseiconus lacunae TaxID=2605694 RepID=UPI00308AB47A|nr:ATP-binding protein [Stieleria sp. HD01]